MSEIDTRTRATANETEAPAQAPPPEANGVEHRITIHELLAGSDAGPKGLDILHRDLFHSDSRVVISAIRAFARIGSPSSARFVARVLSADDKNVRLEAIRCIGLLGTSAAVKLLDNLYKTAADEETRCEALKALAHAAPDNKEVLAAVHEQAGSHLSSLELRGTATLLLAELAGADKVPEALTGAPPEVIERVLTSVEGNEELTAAIVKHGTMWFDRFTPTNRKLLVTVAAGAHQTEAAGILLRGINDDDPEVRYSAYRSLGNVSSHSSQLPAIVERLFDGFETTPSLEEQAILGIDRLEAICRDAKVSIDSSTVSRLRARSAELFNLLSAPVNRVGSDTIELGWLILHSRDYMEYYASEDFRRALVHYLKGGSYHTAGQMLAMLKSTAERVEVRHFDGYRALGEIIKNPKRPGTALITRDLSIAKLGKREPFGRLIRNLRLIRLSSSAGSETIELAARIYTWAKSEKLYRLAEAGLAVLAKFAPEQTKPLCRELLAVPVQSKILAIAAIHFLPSLGTEEFTREVEGLLRKSSDSLVLLNLLDALPTTDFVDSPQIVKAALDLLCRGEDSEVVGQTGRFLAASTTPSLFETVTAGFDRLEEWRQKVVLDALDRIVEEKRIKNRDGLAEFLYKVLRNRESSLRGDAAVILWKLGDDFALKVLDRLLRAEEIEVRVKIIQSLKGYVNKALARGLLSLLSIEHAGLQQALRETLAAVVDETAVAYIREQLTGGVTESEESIEGRGGDGELDTGIVSEKQAFRFEHEFIQELAIFFTDIQGYSRKAQTLTTMQLTSLIHDYEGILLPTVASHRGTLIKKMGDGHLFAFESALDAGLAALRLQKALKRFNSYREESSRVVIRVGVHWGQVVRRDGDVLGNHVNIASRLESAAKGGSILVSQALYKRLEGHIHARELGEISVKNIAQPIKVFEPYEIQIDLPEQLDPLKSKGRKLTSGVEGAGTEPSPNVIAGEDMREDGSAPSHRGPKLDQETMKLLAGIFTSLDRLCKKAEQREIPVSRLRSELRKGWSTINQLSRPGDE